MKNTSSVRTIMLAATLCFALGTTAVSSNPANKSTLFYSSFKNEAVAIKLPGWSMIQQLVAPNRALLQFLPAGEDEKKPATLVNVITYLGLQNKITARTMATNEQNNSANVIKQGKIDFLFIDESNPNDVVYSIAVSGNSSFPDQFEVHRIFAGKDGLHTVIYHVQPAVQQKSKVDEMIQMVKSVKLVPPPKQAR